MTITQDQNTKSGDWSFTETSLADNSYSYIITATDASGRSSTVNAFIVVDITKPVVVITESADVYKNSGAHQFSGTITESNLDTVTAFLYKDTETTPVKEETIYPVNGNWNWTVTGLEDAQYTLKINATDKATNEENKTSTKKLIIDTQKPVIAVTANNLKDDDGNAVTNTLASNGFTIEKMVEPVPTEEILAKYPQYEDNFHKKIMMNV